MAKMKILIAEDDPVTASLIRRYVEQDGHAVAAVCRTGEDSVTIARLLKPDMVLMDIQLEGEIDGFSAMSLVKETRPTPVVFISATTDQELIAQINAMDNALFLPKPFSPEQVSESIQTLFQDITT